MITIEVPASKNYPVIIGRQLIDHMGQFILEKKAPCKVMIISDSNVWPLYGEQALNSLRSAGFEPDYFVIPAGEESKCPQMYLQILSQLAGFQITRSDLIIALGGGVVGDITGFAAATFLRGVPYIQLPTSLLAMVDSSVGGKTAIDLPEGKNLCGAFNQPLMVLCDMDALTTLPVPIFRDGCAEVIKYGILYDPQLIAHLEENALYFDREKVISRCVELKRDVVAEDEFDRGSRMMLNLGHTLGHGVEAKSDFTISHGQAVAIGTAMIARGCEKRGICSSAVKERIVHLLELFGLPIATEYSAEDLFTFALADKKRSGGSVSLILPKDVGECFIAPTPVSEMLAFIEDCL